MTTPDDHLDHGEAPGDRPSPRPRRRPGAGERRTPLWSRGGILTLWIVLGALFCGAVGHLVGQALPGDFVYGAGIGLGAGVALGSAVGTRRADANDREIARRTEEEPDAR
ncbi:hypothetical protein CFK38_02400 [Brachybacterium vulturis]|uniref:Uncharacterized protein n=1 Tax=Brachybacterium vulturis TaxID=2017484 RepID=A0A291GKA5_9MICO|nr:hypothetical protein [Brachybacterium vulturis]ATG50500.1 hypothetical protein CFK38_02400 [Brachybacterium vulturis]